ncbi:MAG: hypothetical protein M0Z62_06745 [Actinomycetota bacterium]|nr:hypothetical protein [Actinomycetota bacterium]
MTAAMAARLPMVRRWPGAVVAVRRVLVPWVVARVAVAAAMGIARLGVSWLRPHDATALARLHQGLLAWDAGWYEAIAGHGYAASGLQSVRFFPLFPLAARVLAWVTGLGAGAAVVVVSNLCALGALALVDVLVRSDMDDPGLATRTVWLLALAPAGYTYVLGYAEGTLLLCTVGAFVALHRRWWWWAAVAGLAAGAVRPLGVLLVVPAALEVWGARPPGTGVRGLVTSPRIPARVAAVLAPLAGAGAYLVWVWYRFGHPLLPLHVQEQGGHRGALTPPLVGAWDALVAGLQGHHLGEASHLPWVVVALVLLVVAFRRLPASYAWFASAVLAVSLTSTNLDSFERYATGAFPLAIAAAGTSIVSGHPRAVITATGLVMVLYAVAAMVGVVVP